MQKVKQNEEINIPQMKEQEKTQMKQKSVIFLVNNSKLWS